MLNFFIYQKITFSYIFHFLSLYFLHLIGKNKKKLISLLIFEKIVYKNLHKLIFIYNTNKINDKL